MPQYVVHKIGFFYNDDSYEVKEPKGKIMGVFLSLEDAKLWKFWQDIEAMKRMAGGSVFRFVLLKDNRDEIYEKVENYTRAEFGIENEEHYRLPKKINDEQAAQFLSIMELTFHNIVEYGDEEVIAPIDLDEDDTRWF